MKWAIRKYSLLLLFCLSYAQSWMYCFQFMMNCSWTSLTSQVMLVVKNLPSTAGDMRNMGSIPGSGWFPGEGHGNRLQYSLWRIPRTEKPDSLQSMGLQRVRHDWSDLAHIAHMLPLLHSLVNLDLGQFIRSITWCSMVSILSGSSGTPGAIF